jgi:hypothetical protein
MKPPTFSSAFADVTIDQAARESETPRATAYRLYQNPDNASPQAVFQRDVALSFLKMSPSEIDVEVQATYEAALTEIPEDLDSLSDAERAEVFRQVIRAGVRMNIDVIAHNPEFLAQLRVLGVLTTSVEPPSSEWKRIAEQSERAFAAEYIPLYEAMAALFGFRPRRSIFGSAQLAMERFAVAVAAEVEGCALRQDYNPYMKDNPRPKAKGAGFESWHLGAVAAEALVQYFFEPDPEHPAPLTAFWDRGES